MARSKIDGRLKDRWHERQENETRHREMLERWRKRKDEAVLKAQAPKIPFPKPKAPVRLKPSHAAPIPQWPGWVSLPDLPVASVEPPVPTDDPVRQDIEVRLLNEIRDTIAAGHYPKGIAISDTLMSVLRNSALVEVQALPGYWRFLTTSGTASPEPNEPVVLFMGVPLKVVEIDDPGFIEVGW